MKVSVPHTWPGNRIKTTLGTQPFSLDATFSLKVPSAGAIQVVNLYGPFRRWYCNQGLVRDLTVVTTYTASS